MNFTNNHEFKTFTANGIQIIQYINLDHVYIVSHIENSDEWVTLFQSLVNYAVSDTAKFTSKQDALTWCDNHYSNV